MSDAIREEYLEEIQGWNWDKIIAGAKLESTYDADCDSVIGREFLGSIFGLTPSGKFYTPFACSNVKLCEHCNGQGSVPNPKSDSRILQVLKDPEHTLRMAMIEVFGPYSQQGWPQSVALILSSMADLKREHEANISCEHCGGCGSEEAYRDEIWNAALEKVAAEHGGFIDYYDSDIFFAVVVSEGQPEDEGDE